MKEIIKNLHIGNQQDYENNVFDEENCSLVLAAKNPFHKNAVGYTGKSCDKNHPEYLIARRGNKLILNMVDAPYSIYFDKGMIDTALEFIDEELNKWKSVYVVCNAGQSRSASLVLLYLIKIGFINGETLEDCEVEYLRIYPNYNPGKGIRDFVKEHFKEYKPNLARLQCGNRFGVNSDKAKLSEAMEVIAKALSEDEF